MQDNRLLIVHPPVRSGGGCPLNRGSSVGKRTVYATIDTLETNPVWIPMVRRPNAKEDGTGGVVDNPAKGNVGSVILLRIFAAHQTGSAARTSLPPAWMGRHHRFHRADIRRLLRRIVISLRTHSHVSHNNPATWFVRIGHWVVRPEQQRHRRDDGGIWRGIVAAAATGRHQTGAMMRGANNAA